MAKARMFPTLNPLPEEKRQEMIGCLNQLAADAHMLLSYTKTAHFNLRDMSFGPVHEMLGELADDLFEQWDDISERAVQLGGFADGTCQGCCSMTTLAPLGTPPVASRDWLLLVGEQLKGYNTHLVGEIDHALSLNDQVTANLLLDIAQAIEKWGWKIVAHTTP